MAQRREDLRVADVDRKFVAERLKEAVDEGRLTLAEYDERLRDTYVAKTYGDLDKLIFDLPAMVGEQHSQLAQVPQPHDREGGVGHGDPSGAAATGGTMPRTTVPGAPVSGAMAGGTPARVPGGAEVGRRTPGWLRGVWAVWATAVAINVTIWLLVSLSSGELVYFWPMWVAGPWGALLLVGTLAGKGAAGSGRR